MAFRSNTLHPIQPIRPQKEQLFFKNYVLKNLCKLNAYILKAICLCHIIHKAAKFACKKLPPEFDIEMLVNKIYAEFPCSITAVRQLKSCYDLDFLYFLFL